MSQNHSRPLVSIWIWLGWIALATTLGCAPTEKPNLAMDKVVFVQMDGKEVRLSELPHYRIALNFYSPTCIPCVKELPTLHYLTEQMKSDSRFGFYLVFEPNSLQSGLGLTPKTGEEGIVVSKDLILKELAEKNIKIPVLIAKEPFSITPDSLITGTPETLLFQNQPLKYYYNFIGSISERQEIASIEKDPKVQFFLRMMGWGEI